MEKQCLHGLELCAEAWVGEKGLLEHKGFPKSGQKPIHLLLLVAPTLWYWSTFLLGKHLNNINGSMETANLMVRTLWALMHCGLLGIRPVGWGSFKTLPSLSLAELLILTRVCKCTFNWTVSKQCLFTTLTKASNSRNRVISWIE